MTVSNILDGMQTHSINEAVGGTCHEGNVVQGAAIFFTECECTTNNRSCLRSNEHKTQAGSRDSKKEEHAAETRDENVSKVCLPGSPVDDVTDPMVKTEQGQPINITNTIVSPLPQKRGK